MFSMVQLTLSQHWFRKWLGAEQAASHYLNQRWPSLLTHICVTGLRWVHEHVKKVLCTICTIQGIQNTVGILLSTNLNHIDNATTTEILLLQTNDESNMAVVYNFTWWRHQMETFSALLAICAGNSPVPGEFPAQRPVTRSFDVFFDLRLNKRLSKQSWGW